jgi:hypothetical protein
MTDLRKRILERRARFIAAALGATAVAGCDRANPLVCLEPPPVDSGTTDAPPSPSASKGTPG